MTLDRKLLDLVLAQPAHSAWSEVIGRVHEICRAPLEKDPVRSIRERERQVGEVDDLISTAAWDLWNAFQEDVPRTAQSLSDFWQKPARGRAVLILDGLSLRELPHLLAGAQARGLNVVSEKVTASELPPETDPFAAAMGFPSRSSLRSGAVSRLFPGAKSTVTDMDWMSLSRSVGPDPNLIIWHQLPDDRIHALENDGDALGRLAAELASTFSSDEFWSLIATLTNGRSLLITSDHGYAAGGEFHEVPDGPAKFLRESFKARRSLSGDGDLGDGSPPLALRFSTSHGPIRLALGRHKWKVPGGFPKLTHGGLTLLEVLSPFIELTQ